MLKTEGVLGDWIAAPAAGAGIRAADQPCYLGQQAAGRTPTRPSFMGQRGAGRVVGSADASLIGDTVTV